MGRINLLTGVIGSERLKRESDQHFRNREAEEAYVRRTVWGSNEEDGVSEDESMRDTVLGDVIHPTPIVYPPKQTSPLLPLILGLLLGAGIPLAVLTGYWLARDPANPTSPEFDDSTVNVGLGRIEDYFPQE
jgi:hypothetical protein